MPTLSQRVYYAMKPFVPWRVRMGLRRLYARRTRARCIARWPISERAAKTPETWQGWPDGKQFALVLTHDVEGPDGVAKCPRLAELEMSLGFRSCFNFIPEGSYRVQRDLTGWLRGNGFEIGVHDLYHDGRLFGPGRDFAPKALRINRHIHEWGAWGFRAAFMLRELNAIHQLDIRYDSSTFDTDPFEFQPDGTETIFPFWIPTPPDYPPAARQLPSAAARGGYVELPYTLPQDSTLFIVLEERSSNIWRRKLDWVAGHGGMALVNVHPDYIRFDRERNGPRTYPVDRYIDLLEHVRQNHAAACWQTLPRVVAEHVIHTLPGATRPPPTTPYPV